MKIKYELLKFLSVFLIIGTQSSCETSNGSDSSVSITPPGAKVNNGDAIEFTASGGFNYQWHIENSSLGFLSKKTGNRTVYTANSIHPTGSVNVIQFLRLTSSVRESTSSSSNGLPISSEQIFITTDEVVIEHLP